MPNLKTPKIRTAAILLAALALGACSHGTEFDETGGVKIARSSCPAVAIPAYTGDVTLFNPLGERTLAALDVTATITNMRTTCTDVGDRIQVVASFDVQARRANAAGPRQVTLPYFATILRAGTDLQSKQLGQVTIDFADGQIRAASHASATGSVSRVAATLPPEILQRITRKRKVGDEDAALDPMTQPAVRDAVNKANFEMLIGFQLSESQLSYNATR
ncbi:hypothetical protein SAMN05444678_11075 [Sphingomonas sp. YR710]|uniref:hypothetical protein n=1 Tax=Sphingomonas sp. YR710 TaxID=1882773 RepID=UPI00088E1E69|nr:hypothetical protein [Sphingomonas sp. YR710]SDD20189.1 hypothetical protein SAMN05444678_11075 [Sphingomonas sp. YR710]